MTAVTLYDELGGIGAIAAVVDIFYDRILADATLSPLFEGVDMERLKRHQGMFVQMATGGPPPPTTFDLVAAHARLSIDDEQFDRVAGHLVAALRVAAVEQPQIDAVVAAVLPLRAQVVTRRAPATP